MKLFLGIRKLIKYRLGPKKYFENMELCGEFNESLVKLISQRIPKDLWERKDIALFSPYAHPSVFRDNKCAYKFFYTQENTHVRKSRWQKWEKCYKWRKAPTLTLGFDYVEQENAMRFPYWLEAAFEIKATKASVEERVKQYNYADLTNRNKVCAFVCRYDYFGDRAQIADLVERVMPVSYPSDFLHNDDDMRGKYKNDKITYLRDFQFNLCPENSNNKGYVTEKIFHAIMAGCVPIYWGNEGYPEPEILNPKAIIYLDKAHPEEGLALLKKLHEDLKAYEEFASQPRFLPGAAEKIYAYYERLDAKLKEILSKEMKEE
jgi:hypothetical protein